MPQDVRFRRPLSVYGSTLEKVQRDTFLGSLNVAQWYEEFYAWQVAMFEALRNGPTQWIDALWNTGRSVTIVAQFVPDTRLLTLAYHKIDADARAVFPFFAQQLRPALSAKAQTMADRLA